MLKLLAANQPLTLYPSTGFNLTVSGPVEGEQAGAYIYSTAVPYEGNAVKFGFPARLTRLVTQKASIAGEIKYGLHILSGQWNAKSSNGKTIELEMLIGGAHFNSLVEGHTLPEYFDITTAIADFPAHINAQVLLAYPAVNHQFPSIYNPGFFEDGKNIHYTGVINDFNDTFNETINATVIVPQLYLLYIVKQLFAAQNYRVYGDVLNDEYLKKALIYNNYSADALLDATFTATSNAQTTADPWTVIYDESISDPLTAYNAATGEFIVEYKGNYQVTIAVNCSPAELDLTITDVYIETLYNDVIIDSSVFAAPGLVEYHLYDVAFEYPIDAFSLDHKIITRVYFLNNALQKRDALLDYCVLDIANLDMMTINTYATSINYKNHVPNMDVKSFLTAFYDAFKILPFFNHANRSVELVFMRDMFANSNKAEMCEGLVRDSLKVFETDYDGLSFAFDFQGPDDNLTGTVTEESIIMGTVDTFSDLPNRSTQKLDNTYFVTTLNAWYKMALRTLVDFELEVLTFIPGGDKHTPVVYDAGKMPLTTQMAPMLMRDFLNRIHENNKSLPSVSALGNSANYAIKGDFPLRIFFYVGLVDSVPGSFFGTVTEYPFAGTTQYDVAGNVVLPIDYTWPGLISRYWLPVIAWYKRRLPIEFTNLVTPAFISTIKLSKRFAFQNTLIFLDEVVVKIKSKLFGPGDFTGWTG